MVANSVLGRLAQYLSVVVPQPRRLAGVVGCAHIGCQRALWPSVQYRTARPFSRSEFGVFWGREESQESREEELSASVSPLSGDDYSEFQLSVASVILNAAKDLAHQTPFQILRSA